MKMDKQIDAYDAFTLWLKRAKEVRAMFQNLGLPSPEPLRRFLDGSTDRSSRSVATVSGPGLPTRPTIAKDDWIHVRAKDTSTKVLLLAFLHSVSPNPMKSKLVIKSIINLKDRQSEGGIYNAAKALEVTGEIIRGDAGWQFSGDPESSPILVKDDLSASSFVWGPITALTVQDQAAHRRDGIRHLLRAYEAGGGLMAAQIVAILGASDWMQVNVNKDLIKLDLETMERDGEIRMVGNTRKWALK